MIFNGEPVAHALAHSRALQYGDGVFRTLLLYGGQPCDWDLHMARLTHDCRALQLSPPDADLLRAECLLAAAGARDGVLKIIAARRGGQRGYAPASADADRLVSCHPLPAFPTGNWRTGVAVFPSAVHLAEQPLLAGIKHLNRLEQVLASRGWPVGVAEAILCDYSGRLIGGTRSNLFWAHGGLLYTPLLTRAGVDGMMKNKLTLLARAQGIEVKTVEASWQELERADEAFLTNSLIGLWPVRAIAGKLLAAPGPLTQRCQDLLRHPVRGA